MVWAMAVTGRFKRYFSGDTELRISESTPVLKVSEQSASLIKEVDQDNRCGRGTGDGEPLTSPGDGPAILRPTFCCIVTHNVSVGTG